MQTETSATLDDSPLVVGVPKIAGVIFATDEPTPEQTRQVRYWIRTGSLKVKRMGVLHIATVASLRAQVTP
jgi:hypothetical protein